METNKGIKILAIDDQPDNLISLKALISEMFPDAHVYSSLTGQQGLKLAKELDPDVIFFPRPVTGSFARFE